VRIDFVFMIHFVEIFSIDQLFDALDMVDQLLFNHQLKFYANFVFMNANHFHQLHLNLILTFNALVNQHFPGVG
jgi:hypothetical protein